MSCVNTDRQQGYDFAKGTCSFCGGESVGYWSGQTVVECCSDCAISILPKLAADSLGHISICHADHAVESFHRGFWRSLAIRLERERRAEVEMREVFA